MEKELRIKIKIDQEGKGAAEATISLEKLGDSGKKAGEKIAKASQSASLFERTLSRLKATIAAFLGFQLARHFAETSDAMALLESRIRLVSHASDDFLKIQKSLVKIADESRTSYLAIGELYARIAPAIRSFTQDSRVGMEVTEAFSKALLISGASIAEAAGATRQFSQAMASGVLRGEEFNSLMENSPRAMRALMEQLGKTQAQLRDMSQAGELASATVAGALIASLSSLKKEAQSMPNTITGELEKLKNEARLLVDEFNKKTKLSDSLARGITHLKELLIQLRSENSGFLEGVKRLFDVLGAVLGRLYEAREALGALVVLWGVWKVGGAIHQGLTNATNLMGRFNTTLKATTAAQVAFNAAARANPYIIGATALAAVGMGIYQAFTASQEAQKAREERFKAEQAERQAQANSYEGLLKQAQALEAQYERVYQRSGVRVEGYLKQAAHLRARAKELEPLLSTKGDDLEARGKALMEQGQAQIKNSQRIKESTALIEQKIAALTRHHTLLKEGDKIEIEALERAGKLNRLEAERQRALVDIGRERQELQAKLRLLESKEYDPKSENAAISKVKDLERQRALKEELLLLQGKEELVAKQYQASLKAANEEVKEQITLLGLSPLEKRYADLNKEISEMVARGGELESIARYANEATKELQRQDTHQRLFRELEVRREVAELTLFGMEKERELELIRHEERLAHLEDELAQKRLSHEEYLRLLGIEQARHLQNANVIKKGLLSAFSSLERALDTTLFSAMKGKFKSFSKWLQSLFKNLGNSLAQSLSSTLASGITNTLKRAFLNPSASLGALALGQSLGASEVKGLLEAGGTIANGVLTTAGGSEIRLNSEGGGVISKGGSDLSTLLSGFSALKSAYSAMTGGISASILGGFNTLAGSLHGYGFTSLAGGVANFGAGLANPFLYGGSLASQPLALGAGALLSSSLIGGGVGYGIGSLGDKLFGAKTKAGKFGAIGGAAGGIAASLGLVGGPIGILAGALAGSLIGGLFGKRKNKASGLHFFNDATKESLGEIKRFQDWEKKSWFKKSGGTDYSDLAERERKQIEGVFATYDLLLAKLGSSHKLSLKAGKYEGQRFSDELARGFIRGFLGERSDLEKRSEAVYQYWRDYAKEAKKSLLEALTESIEGLVGFEKSFALFRVERRGNAIETLQMKLKQSEEEFYQLERLMGVSGVNVGNFLRLQRQAIEEDFTPETIAQWNRLGEALRRATEASDALQAAILRDLEAIKEGWARALASIEGAMERLNPTLQSLEALSKIPLTLENYGTLLNELEKYRQSEIKRLEEAHKQAIQRFKKEKNLLGFLKDFLEELTQMLLGASEASYSFFSAQVRRAKEQIQRGEEVDTSLLQESARAYLTHAKAESGTRLEYERSIAKVREELKGLGSHLKAGSLEGIERAIEKEEASLLAGINQINESVLKLLEAWKSQASKEHARAQSQIEEVKRTTPAYASDSAPTSTISSDPYEEIVKRAYGEVLGRGSVDREGLAFWKKHAKHLSQEELYREIAKGAIYFDPNGYRGEVSEEVIYKSQEHAKRYLSRHGSHASGLEYVPFDGYRAELHKGERVVSAREVRREADQRGMAEEMREMKQLLHKSTATLLRLHQLFSRLAPDEALQVKGVGS